MKLLVIFSAVFFTTIVAQQNVEVTTDNLEQLLNEVLEDFEVDFPPEVFERLQSYDPSEMRDVGGHVLAELNEFVDQILDNLKTLLANSSANTVTLPNFTLKLEGDGQLNLTNGLLEDITSIQRDGDVAIEYSTDTNNISLTLPLKFDDIKYSFDYSSHVLLISSHGGIHGQIKNVKIDAVLSFNFNTYQASLDHYDMKNTGQITVKFTGNNLIDWLIDAISAIVTATLHPVIVDVLQKAISGLLTSVIETINEAINSFLHPTTASTITDIITDAGGFL